MFQETPMLLNAPPLAQVLRRPLGPPKVLLTIQTGRAGPAPGAMRMTSLVPLSLKTLAVEVSTMVVGSGPQSKVITPPAATAATKASPVQLAGVPVPITVVGLETSSAWASGGIGSWPSGFPPARRRP